MTEPKSEPRSFDADQAQADRAVEALRGGVERAREHLRRLRRRIDPQSRQVR